LVLLDGQSWTPTPDLGGNGQSAAAVQTSYDPSGSLIIMWIRGSDLVFDRDLANKPLVVRPNSSGLLDYVFSIGPQGKGAILWQGQTQTGANGFFMPFDTVANLWGPEKALFSDADAERSFAPAWSESGDLVAGYNRFKSVASSDGSSRQEVDLNLFDRRLAVDLAILNGDFSVAGDQQVPGSTVVLNASVRNIGDVPVRDFPVVFYSGSPLAGGVEIGRQIASGWLNSGEFTTVSLNWIVAGALPIHVFAKIDPEGQTGNSETAANAAETIIGATNLSVSVASAFVSSDGSAHLIVKIANPGATSVPTTITVAPAAGGGVVSSAAVPSLSIGSTAQVTVDLAAGTVPTGGGRFVVKVDIGNQVAGSDGSQGQATVLLTRPF
jgi:hypothetical protein